MLVGRQPNSGPVPAIGQFAAARRRFRFDAGVERTDARSRCAVGAAVTTHRRWTRDSFVRLLVSSGGCRIRPELDEPGTSLSGVGCQVCVTGAVVSAKRRIRFVICRCRRVISRAVTTPPSNPHDAYFRQVLARPENAESELRAALPATITARIDWATMALQPGTFVSEELRSRYSDLLYRARFAGRDAYIYLLIEHQSSNDRFMALRMLEYVVQIWNQHRREVQERRRHERRGKTRSSAADSEQLPPVIPLVVHSGEPRSWAAPTDLAELIDLDPGAADDLRRYLPRFQFLLDDVAALDIEALRARELTPETRVMLILHKIAPGNTNLGHDMLILVDDLRILESDLHPSTDLKVHFHYLLIVGDTPETDLDQVIEQLGPRAKEAIVTTAERLVAEGEMRGQRKVLLRLLQTKFGQLPSDVVSAVRSADPGQLLMWEPRILTASTLDEVFA
ncbi:Rpn family recombination-promoting nuclease/putative transposase [Nocardia cyriacigeorgica]|uniref:Rpn family recombination-promoting nuclease/putative transposase n=1 Tax=Nocardia cyriacigeorgica TaxID=135487 RepID=A0A5R8P5N5_9NOCA|nr:Rpn family recombination-promoting nuclease/putative transposase [Nocardia cyriacigeorgica]